MNKHFEHGVVINRVTELSPRLFHSLVKTIRNLEPLVITKLPWVYHNRAARNIPAGYASEMTTSGQYFSVMIPPHVINQPMDCMRGMGEKAQSNRTWVLYSICGDGLYA